MRLALQVVASALTSLWVLYVWLLADEPGSTVSVDHELLELHRRGTNSKKTMPISFWERK